MFDIPDRPLRQIKTAAQAHRRLAEKRRSCQRGRPQRSANRIDQSFVHDAARAFVTVAAAQRAGVSFAFEGDAIAMTCPPNNKALRALAADMAHDRMLLGRLVTTRARGRK
jgi:hypothetical protein